MFRKLWHNIVGYKDCPIWRVSVIIAFVFAVISAITINRWFFVLAALAPSDGWTKEIATNITNMDSLQFWSTMGIAGLGGMVSFLHDAQQDSNNLNFLTAFGHMAAAQFAGLITFFIMVDWEVSFYWSLAASGLAGWSGNRFIERLSELVLGRMEGKSKK